ncbi:MAG: CARDB domain-containing protein [Candidatus Aenigmatarchaeota archaeon]
MGEFKNLFVLTVIVSFFLFLNIAHAGSNDIWKECTSARAACSNSEHNIGGNFCCGNGNPNTSPYSWQSNECSYCVQGPDLIVESLTYSPPTPTPGTSMSFSGTVKNQGGSSASASTTRLRIDVNNDETWDFIFTNPTGTLLAGEREVENWFYIWTARAGTHKFEICADVENTVPEASEDNNCDSRTFSVDFDFSVSVSPSSATISPGESTSATVSVRLISGSSQTVSLSLSGCPSGATCTVSPSSGTPTYTSTLSISTLASISPGDYSITITGTGGGITRSATFTLTVSTIPSLSLSASPPSVPADGISTSTITATTSDSNSGVVISFVSSRATDTLSSSTCTTGNDGRCSVTISSSTAGTSTITGNATGYTYGATSVTFTSPAPPAPGCTYSLSISPSTDTFSDTTKIWSITATDSSSVGCPTSIRYSISKSVTGTCASTTAPAIITVNRGGSTTFSVSVTRGTSSCTLTINVIDPNGVIRATGSYTVTIAGAPHISFFEFSGDTSSFNVRWEAFYPTNPNRDMKVKCSLWNSRDGDCDPERQLCEGVTGKTCRPYDALQGTDSIKRGGCVVDSPVYAFQAENKIYCVFYDPSNSNLKTVINHDFKPIDFDVRSAGKIIATVGAPVDLKIDVVNKGLLPDSYRITLSASNPNTISFTPSITNSRVISSQAVDSAIFSVVSLVDQTNEITVNVKSNTCSDCPPKEITINLQPGLLTLPEFSIFGFLQIIAIATIVYFLLLGKKK